MIAEIMLISLFFMAIYWEKNGHNFSILYYGKISFVCKKALIVAMNTSFLFQNYLGEFTTHTHKLKNWV